MKKLINLLPQGDQREIVLEKINARLLNFFVWIFISLIIIIALFVSAKIFSNVEMSTVANQVTLQQKVVSQQENQKLKNQLSEFNTHLSNLVTLERHHVIWSEIMIGFAQLIPKDVAIDSLQADRQTGNVKISGFAKNRESVLQLRKNILASEYFERVNFPLSNLVKPTNTVFQYSFYVRPEWLKNNQSQQASDN